MRRADFSRKAEAIWQWAGIAFVSLIFGIVIVAVLRYLLSG